MQGTVKSFVSELIITLGFCALFGFLLYDLRKALKKMREVNDSNLISIKNVQVSEGIGLPLLDREQIKSNVPENKAINTLKLCCYYYLFTLALSLIRGGPKFDSIIGLNPCGLFGWVLLFFHLGVSIYLSKRIVSNIIFDAKQGDPSAVATKIT